MVVLAQGDDVTTAGDAKSDAAGELKFDLLSQVFRLCELGFRKIRFGRFEPFWRVSASINGREFVKMK